jgi:hypothetical protein
MKIKIVLFFILNFIISTLCKTQFTFGQVISNQKTVYWFHIRLHIKKDNNSGEIYEVKKLYPEILRGTKIEYDRDLWNNLGKGKIFAIGPFLDSIEAGQSMTFYDFSKKDSTLNTEIDTNKKIFYTILRVENKTSFRSFFTVAFAR